MKLLSFNEFLKINEMAYTSYDKSDDILPPEILNKIKVKLGFKRFTRIGSGKYGTAFKVSNTKVVKISRDLKEYDYAKDIEGLKNKHIADVYKTYHFKYDTDSYVIVIKEFCNVDEYYFDKVINSFYEYTGKDMSLSYLSSEFLFGDINKQTLNKFFKLYKDNGGLYVDWMEQWYDMLIELRNHGIYVKDFNGSNVGTKLTSNELCIIELGLGGSLGGKYGKFQNQDELEYLSEKIYTDNKHTIYHGSNKRFDRLDQNKIGAGYGMSYWGYGFYFSEHKKDAIKYANWVVEKNGGKPYVYRIDISSFNFYELDHADTIKLPKQEIENILNNLKYVLDPKVIKNVRVFHSDYDWRDDNDNRYEDFSYDGTNKEIIVNHYIDKLRKNFYTDKYPYSANSFYSEILPDYFNKVSKGEGQKLTALFLKDCGYDGVSFIDDVNNKGYVIFNMDVDVRPELIETNISENYLSDADIDVFKSLHKFNDRKKYADQNFTLIGKGSGRFVYDINNEYVLKLAKNTKGVAQNKTEIHLSNNEINNEIISKTLEYDENGLYVIQEKATKITDNIFKEITNIQLQGFLYYIRHNMIWDGNNPEFFNKVNSLIKKYNLDRFDIANEESWGIINGKVVIVDYGLDMITARKLYGVKY